MPTLFVPAAPLLHLIDTIGLSELPGMPGTRRTVELPNGPLNPMTGEPTSVARSEIVERTLPEERTYQRVKRMVHRARESGLFTFYAADELCVSMLGLHPCEVYGMDWFEPEEFECNHPPVAVTADAVAA